MTVGDFMVHDAVMPIGRRLLCDVLYGTDEVASILDMPQEDVRRLCESGELLAHHLPLTGLIPVDEDDGWRVKTISLFLYIGSQERAA